MSPDAASRSSGGGSGALLALLLRIQLEAFKALDPADFDPKLYVDLPLKTDLAAAASAFEAISGDGEAKLDGFLNKYFGEAGSDLVPAELPDFESEPEGFLPGVAHPEVRAWALRIHSLWPELARRVSDDVRDRPERHTLLPLPATFVVPGSRFREIYYWDAYWIVRGLLTSKMYDTAKDVVRNLLYLVEVYGFVPNGARTYYTNRSQPPLLSSMVFAIYSKTSDLDFVRMAFPSLLKEHKFWSSGLHQVMIQDPQGCKHYLCRYQARWNKPRPESATTDEESASKLSNATEKERFYRELASAAESGWDFSSRWMSDPPDLTTLETTSIIPVDLNTFICKMEHDIAVFAAILGENSTAETFFDASKSRQAAIASILWSPEMDQWLDYRIDINSEKSIHWKADSKNSNLFASNFIPVWLNAYTQGLALCNIGSTVEAVTQSLERSGLICSSGLATSLINTGQQWDYPNGWAPLQHLIVEGLANSCSKDATDLAESIATRWIRTNYVAYKKTGEMLEKYDVEVCGSSGGGGEYKIQAGFGWSNGVVLAFLEEFGWPADKVIECT